jgi:hypothetical protein
MRRGETSRSQARRRVLFASCASFAALLHAANLQYLAHAFGCDPLTLDCDGSPGPFATPDTAGYVRVAEEIRGRGLFAASYLQRLPGYPALLSLAIASTGSPTPALWLGPSLAALAAVAIAWMAFRLTGRTGAALAAGAAFCCWPDAYQLSPLLLTDAAHGFSAVAAFAATFRWRDTERAPAAACAAGLWLLAQSLRLTFFWIPILLPVLLFKRGASRRYLRGSFALWAPTLILPCLVIGSNWIRHGVAQPSAIPAENLACHSVPRLWAEMGRGSFVPLREACLRRYRGLDYAQRVTQQLADARRSLWAHPGRAAASFAGEIGNQLGAPPRLYYHRWLGPLYASWPVPGRWFSILFWLCAGVGLALRFRSAPSEAAFLALLFVGVMLPAATTHLAGGRLRFPLDLFFLPVVAAVFFPKVDRTRAGGLLDRVPGEERPSAPAAADRALAPGSQSPKTNPNETCAIAPGTLQAGTWWWWCTWPCRAS